MERLVKGIWIPIELWLNKSLSINEKVLLMEIDSFSSKDKECFISDEYIADFLGVTTKTASKIVCSLVEKGYVERLGFDGRRRFLRSRLHFMVEADSSLERKQTPSQEGHTNNNIPNTNTSNNTLSKKETKFQKPTLEEVAEYCRQRQNGIDPETFISFYDARGWMLGKNHMKDWKAAIITWEKRRKTEQTSRQPQQKESVFQHNMKVRQRLFGGHGQPDEQ